MKRTFIILSALLVSLALFPCKASNKSSENSMANPRKHVFLIGFDGLSAYCLKNEAPMPVFKKLMNEGAYTLENRSVLPSSSAVNWASMFMGAGPELHGYTEWGSKTPELPSRVLTKHNIFPDIYSLLRESFPNAELGFFYEWDGMKYVIDTLSVNCVKPISLSVENNQKGVELVTSYIKEKKPLFCSVIFNEPDGVGHSKGWESAEYTEMLAFLDHTLSRIVAAIDEAGIRDESIIILSADHGGINTGHGGKTMKEMQTPLVFQGKGIKKGFQISESTMVYDVAGTISYIFGVNQPQVWIARPIKTIFEK